MKRKTILAITAVVSATFLTGCQTTQERGVNLYNGAYLIPQNLRTRPNDETISHFQYRNETQVIYNANSRIISPTVPARTFKKELESSSRVEKIMSNSAALSYLYFENGKIIYDYLAPQERFWTEINNDTYFSSHSIGKSVVSYLVGKAICDGYIESVDSSLDWDYLDGTVYSNQPLINLLNMRAGDSKIINSYSSQLKVTKRSFRARHGLDEIKAEIKAAGVTPSSRNYSYSNLLVDIVMNYVKFKVGDDYNTFLMEFVNNAQLKDPLYMDRSYLAPLNSNKGESYSIVLTRYDYLRVAELMLNDWKNNTCEGQYLKEIYKRREPKDYSNKGYWADHHNAHSLGAKYGGFFTMNFKGLTHKTILGMHGYGGKTILIDMDNSRIVVVNSATRHYDKETLIYKPLRYGKFSDSRKLSDNEISEIDLQRKKAVPVQYPDITRDQEPSMDGCSDPTFAAMIDEKCK